MTKKTEGGLVERWCGFLCYHFILWMAEKRKTLSKQHLWIITFESENMNEFEIAVCYSLKYEW